VSAATAAAPARLYRLGLRRDCPLEQATVPGCLPDEGERNADAIDPALADSVRARLATRAPRNKRPPAYTIHRATKRVTFVGDEQEDAPQRGILVRLTDEERASLVRSIQRARFVRVDSESGVRAHPVGPDDDEPEAEGLAPYVYLEPVVSDPLAEDTPDPPAIQAAPSMAERSEDTGADSRRKR
jgi:hypothetical protein